MVHVMSGFCCFCCSSEIFDGRQIGCNLNLFGIPVAPAVYELDLGEFLFWGAAELGGFD